MMPSQEADPVKKQFDPYLETYDLINLMPREFYCKTLIQGKSKDPFSLKTVFISPSAPIGTVGADEVS